MWVYVEVGWVCEHPFFPGMVTSSTVTLRLLEPLYSVVHCGQNSGGLHNLKTLIVLVLSCSLA